MEKHNIDTGIKERLDRIEKEMLEQHLEILKILESRLSNAAWTTSGVFGIAVALAATYPYLQTDDPIWKFIAVVGMALALISATIMLFRAKKIPKN